MTAEYSVGLDITAQARIRTFLQEYNRRTGATILLTSHYMADVTALCERILIIHYGQLKYDGGIGELSRRIAPFKLIGVALRDGAPCDLSCYGELTESESNDGKQYIRAPADQVIPLTAQILASFSRIIVWRAWDLILGLVLIVIGVRMSAAAGTPIAATPFSLASFILLAISGVLIIYSLWIVMIALTFWFIKFDNNVTILDALLGAGRYPATVYPPWLRVILTFIVPVAVATSVPLQALRGELGVGLVLLFLGVGAASFLVATRVWKAGVKHYSGASS